MRLIFADDAWEDYLYWQKHDKQMVERINKLIKEIKREPFTGIGKPEALKHALAGFWSRRITDEHRMVPDDNYTSPLTTTTNPHGE